MVDTLYETARAITFNHFFSMTVGASDEPLLDRTECGAHTINFMDHGGFKQEKLGRDYGYTPELALNAQLEEYAREHFGWSHEREGDE